METGTTELYRRGTLGDSLVNALEHFVESEKVAPNLALRVLDEAMQKELAKPDKASGNFKGRLDSYRFCDNVWTFVVSDVAFKLGTAGRGSSTIDMFVDKLQIVAVDHKTVDPNP